MRSLNEELVHNQDASISFQTPATSLEYQLGVSIQVVITGTPSGTLNLQGSNDFGTIKPAGPDQGNPGVVNWTDIANSSSPVTGAGTASWNFNGVFYKWIRLNYVSVSGTGNMTVRINTKGF
jgi:hypothetical protein